jgi:hypothetical protein
MAMGIFSSNAKIPLKTALLYLPSTILITVALETFDQWVGLAGLDVLGQSF